jgi:MFS superfamily sulfate permease-like transporter
MHVSSTLVIHVVLVVLVLMVLPKLLSLIPFWRAGPTLVLECYAHIERSKGRDTEVST